MNKFAHFIVHGKAATYIAALLCIIVGFVQMVRDGAGYLQGSLVLLAYLLVGLLLVKTGRELSLNGGKSTFAATLYFLGCAIAPRLSVDSSEGMAFLLLPVALYLLLKTYRHRFSMGLYFLAFVLVGVACMLVPSLLWTMPFLVLCGLFMESLHGRTLLAALWGLLCPYWVMVGILFLTDRIGEVPLYIQVLASPLAATRELWHQPSVQGQWVWMLLLVVPAGATMWFNHAMRVQANASFRFITMAFVVMSIATMAIPGVCMVLSPCLLLLSSLIGSVQFMDTTRRGWNIYLIILLLLWVFLGGYVYGAIL